MNAIRNAAAGILTGYGVSAFFAFFFIIQSWVRAAPSIPDAARGLIMRHNEHGVITYLSEFQSTSCALLFMTSVPLAMTAAIILPKKNVVWKTTGLAFRGTWDRDDPSSVYGLGVLCGVMLAVVVVLIIGEPLVKLVNNLGFVLPF